MSNENKLELKHIAPYFPYRLKCQYSGIINGSILSAEQKQFKQDGNPFEFTAEEHGLKTGTLKEIKVYKNYWKCYIGNNGRALKSFYNGYDFKPILKPLSDLKTHFDEYRSQIYSDFEYYVKCIRLGEIEFSEYEWFFEQHYDVFCLIDLGLAININPPKP